MVFRWTAASLAGRFSNSTVRNIERDSIELFRSLFPTLPYIGGKENGETINVIMGGIIISIIQPLEDKGLTEREIGKIIFDSFKGYFEARPKLVRVIIGKILSTKYAIRRMKKRVEHDSKLKYDFKFKIEVVEPETDDFKFGYNYTTCALCEMFESNNLKKYHKYMCLGDYALFDSFGIGFKRTATIAHGAPICDFRFTQKREKRAVWPPENLTEWREEE